MLIKYYMYIRNKSYSSKHKLSGNYTVKHELPRFKF